MKRSWQLLMIVPVLFVTVGNTPVYAEHPVVTKPLAKYVRQDQMLVNAIKDKVILVKDKRIFQEKFVQIAERYVAKSSSTPMVFQEPHAYYCSGFVQEIYRENGIWIPAHSLAQQTKFGLRIEKINKVEPGDLVFFSNSSTNKVPAHVGIVIGNGKLLHASGTHNEVSLLEMNNKLRQHFMFATRLVSSV